MKRFYFTCLVVLALSAGSIVQAQTKEAEKETQAQIKSIGRTFIAAMESGDVRKVRELLSESYIGIDLEGKTLDRQQRLTQLQNAELKLESADSNDQIVAAAAQTAVITGIFDVKGKMGGRDISGKYRYLDVWTKTADGWRVISSSLTKVADK